MQVGKGNTESQEMDLSSVCGIDAQSTGKLPKIKLLACVRSSTRVRTTLPVCGGLYRDPDGGLLTGERSRMLREWAKGCECGMARMWQNFLEGLLAYI